MTQLPQSGLLSFSGSFRPSVGILRRPEALRGIIRRLSPNKNMPREEEFAFSAQAYASCENAGLATVGAFGTYGICQGYLKRRNGLL